SSSPASLCLRYRRPDMQRVLERQRRGTLAWIGQAVSGILLLILLGTHMIAHHFVVEGGLRRYDQVLDYVGNPVILAIELVFLVVVTFHAMVGLRAVIFDLGLTQNQEKTVTRVLTVAGLAIFVYGVF